MKKFLVALSLAAFAFVGCGDDSSASAGPNDEPAVESSSAAEHSSSSSSAQKNSSSSEKAKSSSSVSQSDAKQSSSSEKTGKSSGSVDDASSSSVKSESSSSVEDSQSSTSEFSVSSSSSVDKVVSSSSSEIGCKTKTEDNCEYGELVDDRDGRVYKTVKIGDQWWMAENLNYAYLEPTANEDSSSFCFVNEENNCAKYGRLYLWSAAMDSAGIWSKNGKDCGYYRTCLPTYPVRGVCPEGWHLPDTTEWNALFKAVDSWPDEGKVLKSQTGWNNDGNGTDSFGFSALPAGTRGFNGYYERDVLYADFWSSTGRGDEAYGMLMNNLIDKAYLGAMSRFGAYSVRCVKN